MKKSGYIHLAYTNINNQNMAFSSNRVAQVKFRYVRTVGRYPSTVLCDHYSRDSCMLNLTNSH